jgi:hypothetical protein
MSGAKSWARPILVGLAGSAFALLLVVRVFSIADVDPTIFIGFGQESTRINEFAEARLGREVPKRPALGHDGKYFFVQAHDPLLLEPEDNIAVIDRPVYRGQRMLYPLVAGAGGVLDSSAIAWGLLLANVLALGAGSLATAVVAQQMGGSPWWGLAFAFNIGIVSEVNIDGAGVLAAALAFGAVAMLMSDREVWAISFLTLSALSREVMLVVALGVGWWLWKSGRRRFGVLTVAIPCALVGLWAMYLRLRVGSGAAAVEAGFAFEFPFVGLVKSLPEWLDAPFDLAAGVAVVLLLGAYLYRTFVTDALVGWAFIGFVPLTFVLSERVWLYYFDITRAVAPLITAFVLMLFLAENAKRGPEQVASGRPIAGADR